VSALYVGGSGVYISYFRSDAQLFNFVLNGSSWTNENTLLANPSLTSSFDRAFGNLSGSGDYNFRAFVGNLFATPSKPTAPAIMLSSYPNPPYEFSKIRTVEIPTCLSSIRVSIYSGKDRDIKRISQNGAPVAIRGPVVGGEEQKYNFNNERQSVITLNRIQNNFTFIVFYERQQPLQGITPILWFDTIDRNVVDTAGSLTPRVSGIFSKPSRGVFLRQTTTSLQPVLCSTNVKRSVEFRGPRLVRDSYNIMTTNTQLTALSAPGAAIRENIKNFSQFTVIEPLSVVPGATQIIWWMGDFVSNRGYGVVLVGDKIGVGNFRGGSTPYSVMITSYTVKNNEPFVVSSSVGGDETKQAGRRHSVFINGRRIGSLEPNTNNTSTINTGFQNTTYNMGGINTNSLSANSGSFRLLANIVYQGELALPKMAVINAHLINKFSVKIST
jgi:hypothetical protein